MHLSSLRAVLLEQMFVSMVASIPASCPHPCSHRPLYQELTFTKEHVNCSSFPAFAWEGLALTPHPFTPVAQWGWPSFALTPLTCNYPLRTANLRTEILDLRGFDSSIISGGIILVGRLGALSPEDRRDAASQVAESPASMCVVVHVLLFVFFARASDEAKSLASMYTSLRQPPTRSTARQLWQLQFTSSRSGMFPCLRVCARSVQALCVSPMLCLSAYVSMLIHTLQLQSNGMHLLSVVKVRRAAVSERVLQYHDVPWYPS